MNIIRTARMQRYSSSMLLRLAAVAAFSFAGTCHADPGGYVGIRAGAVDGPRETGNADIAAEIFGGYRIDDRWSIEVGAIGASDPVQYPYDAPNADVDVRAEWSALTVSARADAPLSARTRVHLRAGLAAVDVEERSRTRYVDAAGAAHDTDYQRDGTSIGTVLAAGVDVALTRRWSIGFELQHVTGDLRIGCDEVGSTGMFECAFDERGSVRSALVSLRADF